MSEKSNEKSKNNPLAAGKINKLLLKFAIPSVIAMLVNALYNLVDQMFIGNKVGTNGNTATTVAFPITTIALATALLLGQGGAAKQNLELGAGNKKRAEKAVGNMIVMSLSFSVIIAIGAYVFLEPMLRVFGASDVVLPYAMDYARIIVMGIPFAVMGTSLNNSIRADASPTYAMASMALGAITNVILDYIFIFRFDMGMKGAALATITGQILTCIIALMYVRKYKHITITKECFKIDIKISRVICALGVAPCINQLSMFVVQIVLNNLMKYYGKQSIYGEDIPIACLGIVMKVNMIFMAIVIGISQGTQPIISFNYGAKSYKRCKKTYLLAAKVIVRISVVFFALFQIFPRQIAKMFGTGSPEYFEFSEKCFRIFLLAVVLIGLQPLTTIFFTSIGKALKGGFIALTRQIIFLLPLAVILPIFFGVEGVLYAAPIADAVAFILVVVFMRKEFNNMSKLEIK